MKKKLIAALLSGTLILAPCISVLADEKDDKIAELEEQIVELQKTIDELQSKLEKASAPQSTSQDVYKIGESYILDGLWKITINSVEETDDRNEFSDKTPAVVYIITYTYENLGYDDGIMDGLYISLDDGIVDNAGKMGYSYPGNIVKYPQDTPIGASCEAQACIGVDNPGTFKINFSEYDNDYEKHTAIFEVEI